MFWTNAILEMSNTINQPVTFFGKVVDENEAPLKGATVKLTCVIFPEKSSDTNVATGDEGLFCCQQSECGDSNRECNQGRLSGDSEDKSKQL